MAYSAPGNIDELDDALLGAWNQTLSAMFERQIKKAKAEQRPAADRAWLFNPIASGVAGVAEKAIEWTAFPKRIVGEAPTIAKAWERADDSRNNQEEYCEWEVVRDATPQRSIVRVTFTCETEDYYRFLAERAPDKLLHLYRKHVSPNVQLSELIGSSGYIPQNRWNYPQLVRARGILMHMAQINNSLEAAVNLTAVATWPRVDGQGRPITGEQALIACASFGDARRHSDPHIGAQINALVRAGNDVSFADPIGLYIGSIDQSDWETPDGSDPAAWFRILRGSKDHMLRVVFEAPAGTTGHVLGDVKIGGRKLQFGGQIAEGIRIRVTGIARTAQALAPQLTCDGAAMVGQELFNTAGASIAPVATRLSRVTTVVSPE